MYPSIPHKISQLLLSIGGCWIFIAPGNTTASEVTGYDVAMSQMILEHKVGRVIPAEDAGNRLLGIPYMSDFESDRMQRSARLAAKNGDFDRAEFLYMELLKTMDISLQERLEILLEVADMHLKNDALVKGAAILENFSSIGTRDSRLPDVYLKLGQVYRGLGDFKKSQAAFHQVLNVALGTTEVNSAKAQQMALRAKIEITQNFLYMENYEEAERHIKRIQALPLEPRDKEKVNWQASKLYYGRGQYVFAEDSLAQFLKEFPNSPYRLEAEFLASSTLRQLGKFDQALAQVELLIKNDALGKDNQAEALYWKGQAGNQLANTFFEQKDYPRALALYQSLVNLNPHYTWQWPVLYQIGLCYDRMGLYKKARESYQVIVEGSGDLPVHRPQADEVVRMDLAFIQERSQERLKEIDRQLERDATLTALYTVI